MQLSDPCEMRFTEREVVRGIVRVVELEKRIRTMKGFNLDTDMAKGLLVVRKSGSSLAI